MTNKYLLVTIIIFMSGLVFGGIAGWLYYQQANLERTGVAVEGTVIGLYESSSEDGTSYAPIVRFKTQGGRQFEFQSNTYANPPAYKVGETVSVLYPPDSPAKAIIKGESRLLIILFSVLAGIEIIVGTFFGFKALTAIFQGES